jgi:hypothetical protein
MGKSGGGGNSGVKGTLGACSLGAVVKVVEAWRGW